MESLNQAVNDLHSAFVGAAAQELELNILFERFWIDAIRYGITPDDVRLCVKARIRFNLTSTMKRSLSLRFLIGSDDGLAALMSEAAEARAAMRVKVLDKGKREVLRATGRSDEVKPSDARPVGDVIEQMRKAIQ